MSNLAGKTKYSVGDEFYGKRKIIEYCGSHPKYRVSMWRWECMGCGTIHGPSMTATLTRKDREGSWPSCCHPRNTFGPGSPKWSGCEELPHSYWSQVKYSAIKRNINFQISIEDMWEQFLSQNKKCALTGLDLHVGYKNMKASLDRIDSSIGYEIDNIQWVLPIINTMKNNLDESEFINLCKLVAANS